MKRVTSCLTAVLALTSLVRVAGLDARQVPARVPQRPAVRATAPLSTELIETTDYAGLTEHRGDWGVMRPAPGGGADIIVASGGTDTLWVSSVEKPVPTTARVTMEFEARDLARGFGIAIGDHADNHAVTLLVVMSAGARVTVFDRAGTTLESRSPFVGTGRHVDTLSVELRGSAIVVSVNGAEMIRGVAPARVAGEVSVVALPGAQAIVRRIRLERLAGVPAAEVALRTTERVTIPVSRPARFFHNDARGGGSLTTDTVANTVTIAAADSEDRTGYAVSLGGLPAAIRFEADIAMPRTCSERIAGLVFGRTPEVSYGLLLMPAAPPFYTVRLYRVDANGVTGLGDASMIRDTFGAPAERHQFAVEVRGTAVAWSVDGREPMRADLEAEAAGQVGVVAGPACTVRYANLRVSPAP